jgi:SAM-dependent methyltransferase
MVARDPHRFVNELDETAIERLVARLESRAQDLVFARLLDTYLAQLPLSSSTAILEVGCGTGAVLRSIARRDDFTGQAIGVDQCRQFVDAANALARAEGVEARLAFEIGDAHGLDLRAGQFDIVIAHTLISHVTEPLAVLREMARLVRPGGTVVVFDGDYASLTYAFPDHGFGHRMDVALASATFNNPRIMRDLPRLLPELAPLLTVTRQGQAWVATVAGIDARAMPCWLVDRGPSERAIYGLAPDPAAPTSTADGSSSPARHPKVGLHGSSDVVDPELGAAPVADTDLERLQSAYRSVAPALAGRVVAAATCLYTMSPDGHFLVGARRGARRIHFAAGLSGHGFKLAPALGDALVDLALRSRTDLPIDFLTPARFRDASLVR